MLRYLRFKQLSGLQRFTAIGVIASGCTVVAILASLLPPFRTIFDRVDIALYDAFYRSRAPESKIDGPIVILAVDQSSLDRMAAEENRYRWPWPRVYWGVLLDYLQRCGAKAVAVDLLFEEPSGYNQEAGDDQALAAALDKLAIPVIHSIHASPATTRPIFAPHGEKEPLFGAVNVIDEAVVRLYAPFVADRPSLAVESVRAAGHQIPEWATVPFLLHHYGPNKRSDGENTFRYLPVYDALQAAMPNASTQLAESGKSIFAGKIVLIGATAAATFDLKSSPLSSIYPGVEAHATAIQNLLDDRHVQTLGITARITLTWLAALLAAAGALVPRSMPRKLIASLAGAGLLLAMAYLLFTGGSRIHWLPLSAPMLAAIAATVIGLAWTYLVEDRRRRVLLRFLAQYVSPDVAAELNRRGEISLGGERREMTVMFTDIEGFTDLSEMMPVEKLESFINFYLSEMSQIIFSANGTLDKYIGDAIMSFWNAPLDQPDHAIAACTAALGMRDRERELRPRLLEIGAGDIRTRIGINTGPMVVGNLGSSQKVNYTVLGDSVNLASRLEGGNKIYGSQILVAEPTVERVRDRFLFRQLDLLRVKGRKQPMAVFELIAAGNGDEKQRELVRQYEAAFARYQKKEWTEAERILIALSGSFPEDAPASVLLQRVRDFRDHPPANDWDGVWGATEK